ncbi:hypothetical protein DFH06DRAFT_769572 [Mycena polygramma]|nr:hypothetical protein DFH06DRAFT_769572 [Mycena polygramma]
MANFIVYDPFASTPTPTSFSSSRKRSLDLCRDDLQPIKRVRKNVRLRKPKIRNGRFKALLSCQGQLDVDQRPVLIPPVFRHEQDVMFFDVARGEVLLFYPMVFEDLCAAAADEEVDDPVLWDLMDENEDGDEGQTITLEDDIAGLIYWNALCDKASHGSQHAPSAGTLAPATTSSPAPTVAATPVSSTSAVPPPAGSAVLAQCEVQCEEEEDVAQGEEEAEDEVVEGPVKTADDEVQSSANKGKAREIVPQLTLTPASPLISSLVIPQGVNPFLLSSPVHCWMPWDEGGAEAEEASSSGWAGVTTGSDGTASMGPGKRLTPTRTKRASGSKRTKKRSKTEKENVPPAPPLLDSLTAQNANVFLLSAPPRDTKKDGSTARTSGPQRTKKRSKTEKGNVKPPSAGSQAVTTASSRKKPLPLVNFELPQDRRCRPRPAVKRVPLASLCPIPQTALPAAPQRTPSFFSRTIGAMCAGFARLLVA